MRGAYGRGMARGIHFYKTIFSFRLMGIKFRLILSAGRN